MTGKYSRLDDPRAVEAQFREIARWIANADPYTQCDEINARVDGMLSILPHLTPVQPQIPRPPKRPFSELMAEWQRREAAGEYERG